MKKLIYFNTKEINTLEDLKALYKKLAIKLHPDCSGYDSTKDFQEMANEYDILFEQFKTKHVSYKENKPYEKDYGEIKDTYKNIINKYIKYIKDGLTIDVAGCFIFIGDNNGLLDPKAKLSKKLLKLGEDIRNMLRVERFHYSNEKKQWCYSPRPYKSLKKHSWGMDKIKNTFGVTSVRTEDEEQEQLKLYA